MAVIGIGPSEGRDLIDLGFATPDVPSPDQFSQNPHPKLSETSGKLRGLVKGPFGISDDSESEEEGLMKDRFGGGEGEEQMQEPNDANQDQLERHKIQFALSALDDFEEIY
ncbi:unnamed protein product [Phytomonas sp. Hart1]|nr:unnamed protein product [Phytomonas sp. Hart1]|eukprot:CCW66203.1 unnamed protein product [Phytomonas sp. isolate Hart1]